MGKKYCKYCGEQIDEDCFVCPKCGRQIQLIRENERVEEKKETNINNKKKFYEEVWFMWVLLIFLPPVGIFFMWKFHSEMKKNTKIIISLIFGILFVATLFSGETENNIESSLDNKVESTSKMVEVIDFSAMKENEILEWCKDNNLNCKFKRIYSDSIQNGNYIKQSLSANEKIKENSEIIIYYSLGKEPTIGQKNALSKAEDYSNMMHMSKKSIYEQLISKYGEQFTKEEAQYAMDHLEADWKLNALSKAKDYQTTMHMSKNAIYEQLISSHGEQFTKEEAQYAIDNLNE